MEQKIRYQKIRTVTINGLIVNIFLSIVKLISGWLGNSRALLADGIHSLSDLISDAIVLLASKWSSDNPDREHPYGHGRIETLASVFVGSSLFVVAIFMLLDATKKLMAATSIKTPDTYTLAIAFLSILIKELLYQYTIKIAQKINSPLLKANAWHHRTDAISSIIVLIGIGGALAGMNWLDSVAAIIVSFLIGRVGWELVSEGLRELIDTSIEEEKLEKIRKTIQSFEGVNSLHKLKTRYMGPKILVDVHILVNAKLSVSEGHQIAETVRQTLLDKFEEIDDVMIHIDPENDECKSVSTNLPLRNELLELLKNSWTDIVQPEDIKNITLHYYKGKIIVDIFLPMSSYQNDIDFKDILHQRIKNQEDIQTINIFYYD